MEIGTVISTPDSPNPAKVSFVVDSSEPVHRGQFVEMEYSEGTLIALVNNVIKTNRYFERADSVKEFESNGLSLNEQFPSSEWEFLVAETRPLGVFTETLTKRSTFPLSPGTKVRIATEKNLKKFFHFEENGLYLGKVEYHETDVKINLTRMLQKHIAILAQSGAGKSYFTSVLLEELLNRKPEQGRIATIVLDVHGEYTSFAEPVTDKKYVDYSSKTKLVNARNIRIGASKLSAGMFSSILPGLSAPQKRDLGRVIQTLQKKMKEGLGPYSLNDLRKELSKDEQVKDATEKVLNSWFAELDSLNLFAETDSPSIEDLVEPGKMTVIDLSDIINLKKKQIMVNYFANKLFFLRRQKSIPPFFLILEEAHQFCLSEDTQLLTPKGWKNYEEIKVGDLAFSYNKKTNMLEPNSIERIIVKKHKGNLIKLFNEDSIDCLVTGDHRVLCNTRTTGKNRKWKWSDTKFVSADNFPSGARIPVVSQLNTSSKCDIDDDLLKIFGWIITDGGLKFTHNRKYSYYEIYQSKVKGKLLEEMKKTIKKRFPESTVHSRQRKGKFYKSQFISGGSEAFTFYLGKKATDEIRIWLGKETHRIPRKLLKECSLNQLKILFDALVQGDGHTQRIRGNKYVMFYSGRNVSLADEFQELCVLLGFSGVIKKVPLNKQTKVLVSFRRKFAYVRKKKEEYYNGKVWDITIKHEAFVARRNGKVFITGNCPQQVSKEGAISRGILQTIAREGRKFGASLCLISQRPIQLSTTVLSQCNSQIILRITNPYDLKHIGESSEGMDSRSLEMITVLRVGEALMLGEATGFPLFFKVRKRNSIESKHEKSLEESAIEFENNSSQKNDEAKRFL